jgi:hypothetical protein
MVGKGPAAGVQAGVRPPSEPFAARASALDIVILQDDSRSVCCADGGDTGATRLEAARLVVTLVDVGTRVAFVAFGGPGRGCPVSLRQIGSDLDRRLLIADMEAATFEKQGTDYGEALRWIVDALAEGDETYWRPPYRVDGRSAGALFLSDGLLRDRQHLRELREPGGICDRLRERGWPVCTIGLCTRDEPSADVLRELAGATGGRSFSASTADELLHACAAAIAELRGWRWTAPARGEEEPAVERFQLDPAVRRATFVAARPAGGQALRVVDPNGIEACARRHAASRFEHVTVVDPAPGVWTATITGHGRGRIGVMTCRPRGLPEGRADRGEE